MASKSKKGRSAALFIDRNKAGADGIWNSFITLRCLSLGPGVGLLRLRGCEYAFVSRYPHAIYCSSLCFVC